MTISLKNLRYPIIALAALLFLSPLSAGAYFSSDAEATELSFEAGTLEIEVDNSAHSVNLDNSSGDSFSFNTSDIGSIAAQYRLTAAKTTCADAFYNGLDVEVTQGSPVYSGDLSSLLATSTTAGQWDITINPNSVVASENETCEVELAMQAWQTEFSEWNTGGFSDEVVINLTITATEDVGPQPTANIVLNEVYANPNTASSSPLDIEWIELYNGTGSDIDVSGWFISELSNPGEVSQTENFYEVVASGAGANQMQPYGTTDTTIPAGGLLVLEFNSGQSKLNNDKDTVRLYNTSTTTPLDTYSYTSTAEGKSDARIPDGGDWVDPIPSPGKSNMTTITEEDLEAEGWSETKIDSVLGRPEEVAPELPEKPQTTGDGKPEDDKDDETPTEEEAPEGGTDDDNVDEPTEGEDEIKDESGDEEEIEEQEEDESAEEETDNDENRDESEEAKSEKDEGTVEPDEQEEKEDAKNEEKESQESEEKTETEEKVEVPEEPKKPEEKPASNDDATSEETENSDV